MNGKAGIGVAIGIIILIVSLVITIKSCSSNEKQDVKWETVKD
jgi:uncharacterized protein YoxC